MVVEGIVIVVVIVLAVFVFVTAIVGRVFLSLVGGAFRMLLGGAPAAPHRVTEAVNSCGRQGCDQLNPDGARFCRRCGMRLGVARQPVARRAAVW